MEIQLIEWAELSRKAILKAAEDADGAPLELLRAIKFTTIGRHPGSGAPLNFIEQVNQTFTYLVTYRAVQQLMQLHPDIRSWALNLGDTPGTDIESEDGQIVAEVFAAVHPGNNQKLQRDVERVAGLPAAHKYVFFTAPGHCGPQPKRGGFDVAIIALDLG